MITPEIQGLLLSYFDLGASTAENDPLLESAKIETQEFNDLYWHDRIDLIRGIKGSGKTALYRLFSLLQNYIIEKRNTYCVFGVEPSGDPIFKLYQDDFKKFNEYEFENFWSIYFISLVYNLIYSTKNLKTLLKDDLDQLDQILLKMGLKFNKDGFSRRDSIISYLKTISNSKMSFGIKAEIDPFTNSPSITPIFEISPKEAAYLSSRPMYIADFRDELANILNRYEVKIWVMLDRLDEVFPHRSEIEKSGLRSLLKASYNFSHPNLRTKIFMRDDIIAYLAADGFTALTHVTDRSSSTMSWSKDELLYLIIKRISAIEVLRSYYNIDKDRINIDQNYRDSLFSNIFSAKIGKTNTMDWLYTNCSDSNNIVTPRDMIDFLKFAKSEQYKKNKINPKNQEFLISEESFKKALDDLSVHKKDTFLFAEFPHLKEVFLKFEGAYSEYDKQSLELLLGSDFMKTVDDLRGIGFIKHIPKSGTYKISGIWRKGLNIRRGKAHLKRAPRKKVASCVTIP